MTTLWQRQELLEICEWEQVKQAAWTARMERLGQQGTGMECRDEESDDMRVCEECQQMYEKIKQTGKKEGGAVDAGGKEEGARRGKRGAKNAGGQAWINNVSMG